MAIFKRRTATSLEQPVGAPALTENDHAPAIDHQEIYGGYIADPDTVDALRLETSVLSPEEEEILRQKAIQIKQAILMKYEDYIQPAAQKRAEHIEDRIITMNTDTFTEFNEAWGKSKVATTPNTTGIHHLPGDVITLNDPAQLWEVTPDETKKVMVQHYGDEETARKAAMDMNAVDTLTHEIIHTLEDDSLPRTFIEIATNYYQLEITSQLRKSPFRIMRSQGTIPVFEHAITNYGSVVVKKVYFGCPVSPSLRRKVVESVMREAQKYPELIESEDRMVT